MKDQAEGLREKMRRSQTKTGPRTIVVTSGKGGVGKSNVALNFALSLVERGKPALLFDLDVGFANIDILIGYSPRKTFVDMIEQQLPLNQVIERGPYGLELISGGSGLGKLFHVDQEKLHHVLLQLDTLANRVDYIVLDTGAGLSHESLSLMLAADDVLVVTTPEPTSLTDAYGVIKVLCKYNRESHLHLIVNRCTKPWEGLQTARRLQAVAQQFLNKEFNYLGYLPHDSAVQKAVLNQQPFIKMFPASKAAQAMKVITAQYLGQQFEQQPVEKEGRLRSFFKQLIAPFRQKETG
ncbi:ATPase [Caldalkalibacillus thermarum]|uniref:MinD/ParA family protein n=1 Tax=Caldalkalibacillus thermarum TaxID=296745 RepID=UPI00166B7EDB|nr:MinD/ParA family protein [Caldalkalibacillus thermarum]GGK13614.1 ATPase [Caldalkalibacillus thermarum]